MKNLSVEIIDKKGNCTIHVAKTKALISCAVRQRSGFLMMRPILFYAACAVTVSLKVVLIFFSFTLRIQISLILLSTL